MTVLLALALYAAAAAFYVLPSILAIRRRHPNRWLILAVNLFLGPPGWVVALVWVLYATLRPFQVGGPGKLITVGTAPSNTAPDGATSASPVNAAREIEHLSRLREAGHLSEGEFASLKAGVLDRR